MRDNSGDDSGRGTRGGSWIEELLERVGIGAFRVEHESGEVLEATEAMARVFGFPSADAAVGLSVIDHYEDPKERQEAARRLLPIAREKGYVRMEAQRLRYDTGESVQVLMSLVPFFGPDGKLKTMDCLVEDIGERKQAEKAFRSGAERFRLLFENSSVGIVLAAPDGRLVRVNEAFGRFLRRDLDELRGSSLLDLLHAEERAGAAQQLHSCGDGEDSLHLAPERDIRFVRGDGTDAWGQVSCFWLTEDGVAHSLVLVVQDVSDRRRAQEEALRAEKLRSVGMLAGGLAHDYNNILATILGNISLAASRSGGSKEALADLAAAERACQRAKELTQQLLTFAQGGSPVRRPTSLVKVAQKAAYFSLQGSQVQVEFNASEELPVADVDAGQLGQVFQHLFLNARDAMDGRGVVRVRMAALRRPDPRGDPPPQSARIQVEVTDQGHGIAREDLPRIFDPYFTTRPNGTGLGLATVHSIVRRHGGSIEVESSARRGTTFRFIVPACDRERSQELGATGPVPMTAQRARVLVMDDTDPVREVLERVLDRAGFDVVATRDGEEAAVRYEEALRAGKPFAAVVLDLVVDGGVGGVEALRRMRAISPEVRAVVCSGYCADPVMADHRVYGFRGVVPKPFTASQLVTELLRVLEQ